VAQDAGLSRRKQGFDKFARTILPGAKLDMPKACPKGEYHGWYESTNLNIAAGLRWPEGQGTGMYRVIPVGDENAVKIK